MTEENLDQKILSWLNTQGYGAEMQVAKLLSTKGFDVVKSSFYDDPETGISREIDVIGRMNDDIGILNVYSVIECKKSSKPWVVFTSEKAGFNRLLSFAIMTNNAREAIISNLDQIIGIDWFKKNGRIGYGITEAFTSKEDETFKAGIAATKAAIATVKEETNSSMSFLFPTVVLDGRLFESYLGEDGSPIVAEVDAVFLKFPIKLGNHFGSSVRIVTLKAFDNYCVELSSVYDLLKKELSVEVNKLTESIGIRHQDMNTPQT
jgi:hypothetical protein